jgi:hypothetical protein
MVLGDPLDTCDHSRRRPGALTVENTDGVERDQLGHAVRRSAGRAGDVGAVAVAVVRAVPVADEVGAVAHPAAEFLVRSAYACVDDVRVYALPGLVVVVGVVQR